MPACSSSPIDLLAAGLGSTSDGMTGADEPADLMAAGARSPVPPRNSIPVGERARADGVRGAGWSPQLRGYRRMGSRLAAGSGTRIGFDHPPGPRASPKIRRLLQKIDPPALDRAASNWLISRAASTGPTSPSAEPVRIITSPKSHESQGHAAGFSRRTVSPHASAANPDGRAVHLLAAFETGSGIVPGNCSRRQVQRDHRFTPFPGQVDISSGLDAGRSSED